MEVMVVVVVLMMLKSWLDVEMMCFYNKIVECSVSLSCFDLFVEIVFIVGVVFSYDFVMVLVKCKVVVVFKLGFYIFL